MAACEWLQSEAMRYLALATDYDGTLALNGRVDAPTVAALQSLRESGRFGKPGDLRLVFQREQDFYHDLAPASK